MENEVKDALIEKRYSIPYDIFEKAFITFQKKFVFPRNRVISIILLLASVANLWYILSGYGTTFGYVLVLCCFALIFINWYNPRKLRRNLMVSVKGIENDQYELKLYPEKLVIGTVLEPLEKNKEKNEKENKSGEEYEDVFESDEPNEDIAETEIVFGKDIKVVENLEFFIVYIKRAMFYVIPKNDFSEEENMMLKVHFENKLGRNFIKDKGIA